MTVVHRPWSEIGIVHQSFQFQIDQSRRWAELIADLPDASGEFTGYWDSASVDPNYFDFRDACSPDTSQPYPF